MEVIKSCKEMQQLALNWKREGKVVGLIPTMGFLHAGHLSLVAAARKECDIVVLSIFVNPTQFGLGEDFSAYPRDLHRDSSLAEKSGVDVIFSPSAEEMYPEPYETYVQVADITKYLCGVSRPGHFKGVATIVTKLLMLTQPEKAYFGQKDGQQFAVITRMVKDLNIPVEVRPVPIYREEDGMAMSSRNVFLSAEEREQAVILSQSLKLAVAMYEKGERNAKVIKKAVKANIRTMPLATIDYVEIVDQATIVPVDRIEAPVMLAMAVSFGKTRLIDNVLFG